MPQITSPELLEHAAEYLQYLCTILSTRATGSADNRAATDFFASRIGRVGFNVEESWFDCMDWSSGEVSLSVNDEQVPANISPFSPDIDLQAPLIHLNKLEQITSSKLEGKIALLTGELVVEQLMPKNFPFYNPEHHQEIIAALEHKRPAALIAATGMDPQMAGGLYPFPLIEDGDFDIPSVYIKDVDGIRLAALDGETAVLRIEAQRISSTGCNVIARKGGRGPFRLIYCAHIDAKEGTPGALDNAAGIVTLLLLAERLQSYEGGIPIEIVALNGEDYYAASGEVEYLRSSLGPASDILLAINIDGAGYVKGHTAFSFYGVSDDYVRPIRFQFSKYPGLVEGESWYQSDHSLFIQQGVPAMAFTSDQFDILWSEIAHTPADRPDIVSLQKLVELSSALYDLTVCYDQDVKLS